MKVTVARRPFPLRDYPLPPFGRECIGIVCREVALEEWCIGTADEVVWKRCGNARSGMARRRDYVSNV